MKLKQISTIFLFLFLLAALISCGKSQNQGDETISLTISAAASLNEALSEIKTIYESDHKGIELLLNFGGSGSLQQQITQGAPVDLFFSAAEDRYNQLVDEGLIDSTYSTDLLGNQLVLITPKQSNVNIEKLQDLLTSDVRQIAIGIPETVPAGMYAQQTLKQLGLWEKLSEKIIPSKDVRQVLSYVETNNVDAGIVYKSDALSSNKVNNVMIIAAELHDPIIYPVGIVDGTKNQEEAVKFFKFLQSDDAIKIFQKYGFNIVGKNNE
ncbi:molybdate ABC transporter substrate-binding protein [Mesobacillus maritimus]|nr:molybdate ABC transporter substrate-binding protein [Mesobacillus maritimus]MCM3588090.1 molybdate ABC transporter substrate-binding protein [Mesobacillus maritimus]MCM3668421.1 molybdate ABC transporter substrate-binding protein [Mesobacillus maritimus]